MKEIRVQAHGKINLVLNVGPVRDDGFHEVSMVMQEVEVCDELRLVKKQAPDRTIDLVCENFDLAEADNIAYRCARLMQEKYSLPGFQIFLRKTLPVAAGMAGGSSDAAAVIEGADRLFELGLSRKQKEDIGASLGSDIPFFFTGGTCIATGRGEQIRPIADLPGFQLVLVKPDFGISTPWSYRQFDRASAKPDIDLSLMEEAIESGDPGSIRNLLQNHLEPAALTEYPVIQKIKEDLLSSGAFASMMTGSGPTVFGMFENAEEAGRAACRMKELYPEYQVIQTAAWSRRDDVSERN